MRVGNNQDPIQSKPQVQSSGGNPAPAPQAAAQSPAQPLDAQAFAAKQKQALSQSEARQGGNQGNSILGRLAELSQAIPVIRTSEPWNKLTTNDADNHSDKYVHLEDDAVDTPTERDDLQYALRHHGSETIFVKGEGKNAQYFKAAEFESGGQKQDYKAAAKLLKDNPDAVFTLHDLAGTVKPLEGLGKIELGWLQRLDTYQHQELDQIGQGREIQAVLNYPGALEVAHQFSHIQLDILASLPPEKITLMLNNPNKQNIFAGVLEDYQYSRFSHISSQKDMQAIQALGENGFKTIMDLRSVSETGRKVLTWKPEELNVLKQLDQKQFKQLQDLNSQGLNALKSVETRQETFKLLDLD